MSTWSTRTIPKNDMLAGEMFHFGKGYHLTSKTHGWNPDSLVGKNPHALITGNSGSGKTTLLREVIRYLSHRNKMIFILDLHGDLHVPGVEENYIEITARNPKYGINPFEFYPCPKNGGIAVQRDNIVQLFRKSFIPNLGALQEKVLKQLIMDTYTLAGITDDDPATWDRDLPTMEHMSKLVDAIMERINTGLHYDFIQQFEKSGKKVTQLEENVKFLEKQLEEVDQEKDEKKWEIIHDKIVFNKAQVNDIIRDLDDMWAGFRQHKLYGDPLGDQFGEDIRVNLSFYCQKDVRRALETLSIYITTLYETKVFHSAVPPTVAGVNRFDISGLDHSIQLFFTDVLLQKIFRAKKLRGEYGKYPTRPRGQLTDTFVVIDESKLVMPTGKDKESPFQAMNRIAAESRKYGLGLVLASQKPNHYPHELLTNIDLKVVLTTAPNDIPQAKKLLGIQDEKLFGYAERFGVALISSAAKEFEAVCLPWVDTVGWGESASAGLVRANQNSIKSNLG